MTAVSWSPMAPGSPASGDKSVRLWGRELLVCEGHESEVTAVSWSSDGSRLASGSNDSSVRLWEAQSGVAVIMLRETLSIVSSVHWSGSREVVSLRRWDGTARIWDVRGLASLVPSPARETWLVRKTAPYPEKRLIEIPCVAIFFASGDGLLAARPDKSTFAHERGGKSQTCASSRSPAKPTSAIRARL